VVAALAVAAAAAREGADATAGMQVAMGRSAYVPTAALQTVPDPGAQAVAIWLGAVAKAIASA